MVKRIRKQLLLIALSLSAGFIIFSINNFVAADNTTRSLQYLPHDEVVDSVNKKYEPALIKQGISCEAAFEDATRCFYCVQTLKSACPDCCLSFKSPKNAIRCTKEDDARFDCPALAYATDSCPLVADCKCPATVTQCSDKLNDCRDCPDSKSGSWVCSNLPHCQELGCPSAKPKASIGKNCVLKDNQWICEENNLSPEFTGCKSNVSIGNCQVSQYYVTTLISDCQGLTSPPPSQCYQYLLTPEYQNCINTCQAYTNNWEKCTKSVNCCNQKVCGTGFTDNCAVNLCQERIDWPECDNLTLPTCINLQQEALACLSNPNPGGGCGSCFEEIDPNLYYKFVARSRETSVIFWQVLAETEFSGTVSAKDIPTYFFTMVKITDTNGREVHRSVIHQKSFQGSFSIFSATAVDAGTLQQGETYTVRLYYFLPEKLLIPGLENVKLSAQIKSAGLIVTRTRN